MNNAMRTVALVLAVVSLAAPTAHADEPKRAASSTDSTEAERLFHEGTKLMDSGDYEGAVRRFLKASQLELRQATLYNLGYCETKSGHRVEGVNHLRQFLRGPHVTPTDRSKVNDTLLPLVLPYVAQLLIETKAGASITIDANAVGDAPLPDPIAVTPGKHHVTATLDGAASSMDVELAEGQTLTMSLPQTQTSAAPAAVPATPIAPQPQSVRQDSTVEEPHAATPGVLTTGRKIAIGIGVAAIAAAGVGIGFGVSASNADSNAASLRAGNGSDSCTSTTSSTRCANLQNANSTAQSNAPVATELLVGGGVLAVGAVVVWLLSPSHPSRSGMVQFMPALDRTGAGFRLVGAF